MPIRFLLSPAQTLEEQALGSNSTHHTNATSFPADPNLILLLGGDAEVCRRVCEGALEDDIVLSCCCSTAPSSASSAPPSRRRRKLEDDRSGCIGRDTFLLELRYLFSTPKSIHGKKTQGKYQNGRSQFVGITRLKVQVEACGGCMYHRTEKSVWLKKHFQKAKRER